MCCKVLVMRKFSCGGLVAIVFALVGCGMGLAGGLSEAEDLAVEACGMTPPDASGGDGWVAPDLDPSLTYWTLADPIAELVDRSENWGTAAVLANRAAQRDSRFDGLSEVTRSLSSATARVVSWAQSDPSKHSRVVELPYSDPFFQQAIAIESEIVEPYNADLLSYKIECNALADDLNGG